MSTHSVEGYRFNARTFGLVALFAVVIGAALAIRPWFIAGGAEPAMQGSSTGAQAATGAAWAVAEAVFAGTLLLGIVLWRRFPEWLQEAVTSALKFGFLVFVGVSGVLTDSLGIVLVGGPVLVFAASVAEAFDLWWVVNNVLAVGIAVYAAAGVGIVLGPVILGVGLVGLTVYDYVFADREGWMFDLAAWTVRHQLPALFIVPTAWRLDWDELADALGGDEDADELLGWGIGMADLLLPAAFAVSLVDAGGLLVHGAIAGTLLACARVSWKMEQGAGAGLPPLVTGALGGWGVAAIVGVVLA